MPLELPNLGFFDNDPSNDAGADNFLTAFTKINTALGDIAAAAGITTRKEFNVLDYGANGNGVADNSTAFQNCFNAAIAVEGTVIIPPPASYYRINSTINVIPASGAQARVDVKAKGGVAMIRYFGANNTACFSILGLKESVLEGLSISIENGRTGCVAIDIDTSASYGSTSYNILRSMRLSLGGVYNGGSAAARNEDCIGIRMGLVSGGGADISNYTFEGINVFGGGSLDLSPNQVCAGQYAFQNLGTNCLSNVWLNGFAAYCDRCFSNVNRSGSQRGSSCVNFFGIGGSRNNVDFVLAFEQAYKIVGGRWELGNKFLQVVNGGHSNISIEHTSISDYKQNSQIELSNPCSMEIKGVRIYTSGTAYTNCIAINSNNRFGSLSIKNCSFSIDAGVSVPYTRAGTTQWKIDAFGNVRMVGVNSSAFMTDQQTTLT